MFLFCFVLLCLFCFWLDSCQPPSNACRLTLIRGLDGRLHWLMVNKKWESDELGLGHCIVLPAVAARLPLTFSLEKEMAAVRTCGPCGRGGAGAGQ